MPKTEPFEKYSDEYDEWFGPPWGVRGPLGVRFNF